ncbi:hypothetical protein KEM52_000895 [Ascosphaera acerosa]|nr:hypothetical protein KEM52_000895 [Ascosphaera acerosa]
MEGVHLENTHGFALPMTDHAPPRQALAKDAFYGHGGPKNDSAVKFIHESRKPDPHAVEHAASVKAARNALGYLDRPYEPASGKKPSTAAQQREQGPWSAGREARPLPQDSLAGIPRPEAGEKEALVDKRYREKQAQFAQPLRQQALAYLREQQQDGADDRHGRQSAERKLTLARHVTQGQSPRSANEHEGQSPPAPVQVLPAADESGWMVAPTPQLGQPAAAAASDSPEVGVPIKTTAQQPVSERTQEHAARLHGRQASAPAATAAGGAGAAATQEAAALDESTQRAAAREAAVRSQTSQHLEALQAATRAAKHSEDEYRHDAEREVQRQGLATREANMNAMVGKEAAGVPPSQGQPGTSEPDPAAREEYEHALRVDEYNRFRNATGIGKPAEPLTYHQPGEPAPTGTGGSGAAAGGYGPGAPTAEVGADHELPKESMRDTLKVKARYTRHDIMDKMLRRGKYSKANRQQAKEAETLGQRPGVGERVSSAGAGASSVGHPSQFAQSDGSQAQPRHGVQAARQADAGHGIAHRAPGPLGRTLPEKDRPVPHVGQAGAYTTPAGGGQPATAGPSTGAAGIGTGYGSAEQAHTSSNAHVQPTLAEADDREEGAPVPVATAGIPQREETQGQVPYSADPGVYNPPSTAAGQLSSRDAASQQQAPEIQPSQAETTDRVPRQEEQAGERAASKA